MFNHKTKTRSWPRLFFACLLLLGACENSRQSQKDNPDDNQPQQQGPTSTPIDQLAYLTVGFRDASGSTPTQLDIHEMTDNPSGLKNIWKYGVYQIGLRKLQHGEKLSFTVNLGTDYEIGMFSLEDSDDCRNKDPNAPYLLKQHYSFWGIQVCGPIHTKSSLVLNGSYQQGAFNVIF
jgi:hypothetical protein